MNGKNLLVVVLSAGLIACTSAAEADRRAAEEVRTRFEAFNRAWEARDSAFIAFTQARSYSRLLERLVGCLALKLRIEMLFFGSSTMKRRGPKKGTEPDACFYVQSY